MSIGHSYKDLKSKNSFFHFLCSSDFWIEMGLLKKWEQRWEKFFKSPILREPFYIFTLTLLSLLLPLSFLLLARLSNAQYSLTFTPYPPSPASYILSLFLYTNPTLLHCLVAFISVTALVHGLTGQEIIPSNNGVGKRTISRTHLYVAWMFLCALQVCVGLGIEAILAADVWPTVDDFGVGTKTRLISRMILFVGLHETMLHWSRIIVRPVVDDTIFGYVRTEHWIEKVVIAASFGALWLWRLRDGVEALVLVVEIKIELLMGLGMADLVSWWLYYLTVTIGMVRIVKGFVWFGRVLLCRRRPEFNPGCFPEDDDNIDKV